MPSQKTKAELSLLRYCAKGNVRGVDRECQTNDINPNVRDAEGNTPLIIAAEAGYTNIIEMLLNRFPTIEIDQVNDLGQSALMKAAIQGRVASAKALLRAGANASLRDSSRRFCALDWSEYVGRTECANMIALFMLKSPKLHRAPFTTGFNDLQNVATAIAVPLLGNAAGSIIPKLRPRFNSAPIIPRLEITTAPDMGPRKQILGILRHRPRSSLN